MYLKAPKFGLSGCVVAAALKVKSSPFQQHILMRFTWVIKIISVFMENYLSMIQGTGPEMNLQSQCLSSCFTYERDYFQGHCGRIECGSLIFFFCFNKIYF